MGLKGIKGLKGSGGDERDLIKKGNKEKSLRCWLSVLVPYFF